MSMTNWDQIRCEAGHDAHLTERVMVNLAERHGYADLPAIPERLAISFPMTIYAWEKYQGETVYCPGHDAVSETIDTLGVWEPAETALVLSAARALPNGLRAYDFGSHIGWFSLLMAMSDLDVVAFDADPENHLLLADSANRIGGLEIERRLERIGPDTDELPNERIGLVKIDLEGAEHDAVRMLWPAISSRNVDHLLIEISPVFDDYYPELVNDIIGCGYMAWVLPDKSIPPASMEEIPGDLEPWRLDDLGSQRVIDEVASWHQRNVFFATPEALFS